MKRLSLGLWLALRRPAIVLLHLVLAIMAFALAFAVRFDFEISVAHRELFLRTAPVLVGLRAVSFAYYRLHRGLWHYIAIPDLVVILKAVTASSAVFAATVFVLFRPGFSRSVLLLDWLFCLALVVGVRIVVRVARERRRKAAPAGSRRAVIVGAGDAGDLLAREIERGAGLRYHLVGFVDDDPATRNRQVRGVEVLGTTAELASICVVWDVDEVLIAVPSATDEARRAILDACRQARKPFKTVPGINDLDLGRRAIGQLQEVAPEDLLGREPIDLDLGLLRDQLKGRHVLVTGAAGSIGSELCRQLLAFEPAQLTCLDQAESALYLLDLELRDAGGSTRIVPVVADVTDEAKVAELFAEQGPDVVYHAAAYKHVPLMEADPLEAIRNNVLGTATVVQAALDARASRFVLISTDKAVRAVGVMGKTKRVAERIVQHAPTDACTFVAVRFGNVLGSDGSVLPLLQWQAARGKALTVTDRDATRYFMLVREAAQLVLQAGAMAQAAEVFFLDMGEPVRIGALVDDLIRLSGLEADDGVNVDVIGLRAGERMSEILVRDHEQVEPTTHPRVLRAVTREPSAELDDSLATLFGYLDARDRRAAVQLLDRLAGEANAV